MPNQLTAIDLFSGAGGFSLAAHQQGFNILAAVEFDQKAAETYQFNIVERLGAQTQVFNQDINKVDVQSLMRFQGIKQGELDLLLGGPPCQGFSTHRINDSGADDPRNQLLLRYFDFVAALMPKVFIVENVPGLLWKRHESYLNKFIDLAHQHHYRIVNDKPLIINARDYGLPQSRKRAFILAVRSDVCMKDLNWPPTPTHFEPKLNKTPWKTASSVFEKPSPQVLTSLVERYVYVNKWDTEQAQKFVNNLEFGTKLNNTDPCNIHMQHTPTMLERLGNTPLNGSRGESGFTLRCHSNGYKGHKDVYGRIFFHVPSNTMTTGCNNPSKGRFVHPWENHGITLRHAARLQSFPDSYEFIGNITEKARQIGNAVPVKLGNALIKKIKNELLTPSY